MIGGNKMILCVVGPTGVGKTKLSIELAKIYNGEIINADAMQVYKGLDIGTAKVTQKEKQGIIHHLLDIKEVKEDYSVFDYQKDARKKIEEIKKKGKVPILVGGTGYYVKAALYDYEFSLETETNDSYDQFTEEEIYNKIMEYELGIVIDKKNRKRNVRLLQKLESGEFLVQEKFHLLYNDVMFIGLTTDRALLYERINKRLDEMIIDLIDEVKPYYLNGITTKALMNGIGYKELYPFFANEKSLHDCVEDIKKNSRNYAKRQYTWFQNQMDVHWFDVCYEDFFKTIESVITWIEEVNGR